MEANTLSSSVRDVLSPLCMTILQARAGAAYAQLVVQGTADAETRALLATVQPSALLARAVREMDEATAMLAGLLLWHDCLDESHQLSQGLKNPTGSFWHAIMHRREGDFSNAKYWYARCREHPALAEIPAQPNSSLQLLPTDAFVDLVEQIHARPDDPRYAQAVRIQQIEWRTLFEYCAKRASGVA